MIWQDLVFATGSFVLCLGLIPTLRNQTQKPPVTTSLLTGLTLATFTITYATMSLVYSTVMTGLTASLWLWIAGQVWREH